MKDVLCVTTVGKVFSERRFRGLFREIDALTCSGQTFMGITQGCFICAA